MLKTMLNAYLHNKAEFGNLQVSGRARSSPQKRHLQDLTMQQTVCLEERIARNLRYVHVLLAPWQAVQLPCPAHLLEAKTRSQRAIVHMRDSVLHVYWGTRFPMADSL